MQPLPTLPPLQTLDFFLNAIKARPVGGKHSQRKLVSLLFKRGEKSRFSAQTKRRFLYVATNGHVDRMNFLNASTLPGVWDALAPFLARIPGAFEALLAGDGDRIASVRDVLDVAIKAVVHLGSVAKVDPSIMDDAIAAVFGVPVAHSPPSSPTFRVLSHRPGRAEDAAVAAATAAVMVAARDNIVLPPSMVVTPSPREHTKSIVFGMEDGDGVVVDAVAPAPVSPSHNDGVLAGWPTLPPLSNGILSIDAVVDAGKHHRGHRASCNSSTTTVDALQADDLMLGAIPDGVDLLPELGEDLYSDICLDDVLLTNTDVIVHDFQPVAAL